MKYFFINVSLNKSIVGKYPQVEDAIYSCDVWEEPKFIDNVTFKKIDFEPILAKAKIVKKALLTDLLSADIVGFYLKPLVSDKLKKILQKSKYTAFQFYNAPIIYENVELNNYWLINPYKFNHEELDFSITEVYLMERTFNKVRKLTINTFNDYLNEKDKIDEMGYPYSLQIENVHFLPRIINDFLILQNIEGGTKYIVSERLKKEIEDANCTGIEFMPIELTLNEWLASGGEREKKYGKA